MFGAPAQKYWRKAFLQYMEYSPSLIPMFDVSNMGYPPSMSGEFGYPCTDLSENFTVPKNLQKGTPNPCLTAGPPTGHRTPRKPSGNATPTHWGPTPGARGGGARGGAPVSWGGISRGFPGCPVSRGWPSCQTWVWGTLLDPLKIV